MRAWLRKKIFRKRRLRNFYSRYGTYPYFGNIALDAAIVIKEGKMYLSDFNNYHPDFRKEISEFLTQPVAILRERQSDRERKMA